MSTHRRSRVPKLDSIPPAVAVGSGVAVCIRQQPPIPIRGARDQGAAARGNEEAGWLLGMMRSKGDIPEFGYD